MASAMGTVNEFIDRISNEYDRYYDQVKNYTAFKLAESTAEKVDSASGVKNIVAKPLDTAGKIGRYWNGKSFKFQNYPFFPLNSLIVLAKPVKELIGATECFTKIISILKDIRYYQPRKYVVVSQCNDASSSKIAYYHQNRFDRFLAISNTIADWALSCADWADFLKNPNVAGLEPTTSSTWLEPTGRWSGRILSYTGLWNEGMFLYRAYTQQHRNNDNTKEVQGKITKQEIVGSALKLAFLTMFVVIDIFANSRFSNRKVVFWTGCLVSVAQPLVFHYYPNFVTKPVQREVEEAEKKAVKA